MFWFESEQSCSVPSATDHGRSEKKFFSRKENAHARTTRTMSLFNGSLNIAEWRSASLSRNAMPHLTDWKAPFFAVGWNVFCATIGRCGDLLKLQFRLIVRHVIRSFEIYINGRRDYSEQLKNRKSPSIAHRTGVHMYDEISSGFQV